jgi:hypothetical protein
MRDLTLLIRNKTPSIRDQTQLIRDQTPLIRDQTPLIKDQTPLIRDQTPTNFQTRVNLLLPSLLRKHSDRGQRRTQREGPGDPYLKYDWVSREFKNFQTCLKLVALCLDLVINHKQWCVITRVHKIVQNSSQKSKPK